VALALWEHPDRRRVDLRALRTGAAIGPPHAMQMVMDLGAHEICNVYGLTECYGNCTVTEACDPVEVRLHTVGHPLPGMQIKIADPQTHRPLPHGAVGEIAIRGYLMPGYYQAPAQTAATFDPDGYFLSGDFGFLDEEGRLHFQGRLKDMVKTGGINVAPLEVEELLTTHPAVEQAYVVGVPDPRKEEVVAAVVVCKPGSVVTEEELRAFCRQALAAFKVPQRFWFVPRDALPLTASGKVQKHVLRAMLVADDGDRHHAPDG
jgi:fatty-acyl-CoA synthase